MRTNMQAAQTVQNRNARHLAGLRLIELWVPDTRLPDFQKECARQARLVAEADKKENELETLMNQALEEVEGWTT